MQSALQFMKTAANGVVTNTQPQQQQKPSLLGRIAKGVGTAALIGGGLYAGSRLLGGGLGTRLASAARGGMQQGGFRGAAQAVGKSFSRGAVQQAWQQGRFLVPSMMRR